MKEKDNIAVYLQILTVKHLSEVVDIRYNKHFESSQKLLKSSFVNERF